MSTVWDRTVQFLSDNLGAVGPVALVTMFVPLAMSGSIGPLMGTLGPVGDVALGLVLVLLSLVSVWGNIAITAIVLDPALGRAPAIDAANRRIAPLIGMCLLLLIGVCVLALPFGIALGLSGVDMAELSARRTPEGMPNRGAASFMAIYLPVFLLLLLWFSARLAVLTPTLVMERRGLGTFARSFALTRRMQWKLVGVLILYLVVSFVASLAARTVFGTLFGLLLGGDGPVTPASVLTSTMVAGVSTGFSLIAIVFVARTYLAARDAREAIVDGAVGRV